MKQRKMRRRFSGVNTTSCDVCGATQWGYLRLPTQPGEPTMCNRCVGASGVQPSLWKASETSEEGGNGGA